LNFSLETAEIRVALENALQHQRSGQWAQAAGLCDQVLATDPDNVEALHLLGCPL
jgi:cytochrome c-type biogenesis protein CcmH/NrfG